MPFWISLSPSTDKNFKKATYKYLETFFCNEILNADRIKYINPFTIYMSIKRNYKFSIEPDLRQYRM